MPWRHMGEWRYSSNVLDLGSRCRWVVSFTTRPLYPWGYRSRYPLDKRLGGPRLWTLWRRQKLCHAGNRTRAVKPVTPRAYQHARRRTNSLDLYSGDTLFESRLGHGIWWRMFIVTLRGPSRRMPWYYLYQAKEISFQILSKSLLPIILSCDAV
jgi:hypothetical protein